RLSRGEQGYFDGRPDGALRGAGRDHGRHPRRRRAQALLRRGPGGALMDAHEAFQERREERKFRRLRRKAREAAGEIDELNITPMLDMMTIILVFLLKTYNTSTVSVSVAQDLMPPSSTTQLEPSETSTITITASEIT